MIDKKDIPSAVNINIAQYICIFYKEFQRYSEEKLKPYKLTNGLYIYLIFVYKKPECTLNEISKDLKVDKAHTTRAINKDRKLMLPVEIVKYLCEFEKNALLKGYR